MWLTCSLLYLSGDRASNQTPPALTNAWIASLMCSGSWCQFWFNWTSTSSCKLLVTVSVTPLSKSLEIGVIDCVNSVDLHVANVNVGGSNPLPRFKQCIALTSITSHLCGVYLFAGVFISSMLFAMVRTVLHRFVHGFGTVSGTVIRASCKVFCQPSTTCKLKRAPTFVRALFVIRLERIPRN